MCPPGMEAPEETRRIVRRSSPKLSELAELTSEESWWLEAANVAQWYHDGVGGCV